VAQPTTGVVEITLRVDVSDAAALIEAGQRSIARDNHPTWEVGQPSPTADDPDGIIDSPAQAIVDLLMEGLVRCFGYNGAAALIDKVASVADLEWTVKTWVADAGDRYPRGDGHGGLVWACCASTIGPPCRHRTTDPAAS
jgi:hypothetical protein